MKKSNIDSIFELDVKLLCDDDSALLVRMSEGDLDVLFGVWLIVFGTDLERVVGEGDDFIDGPDVLGDFDLISIKRISELKFIYVYKKLKKTFIMMVLNFLFKKLNDIIQFTHSKL